MQARGAREKNIAYFYGQPQPTPRTRHAPTRLAHTHTHALAQHTPLCKLLTKIYTHTYIGSMWYMADYIQSKVGAQL